jgi:putative flippase GtrA
MSIEKVTTKKTHRGVLKFWTNYKEKHPNVAQFLVFFLLSNGVTVLQFILMPLFKSIFAQTALVDTSFRVLQFGQNFDGSPYYVFDYAAGALAAGGGGGLAYFLAVQITIAIAQIINFFAQRSITFKSNSNIWKAAFWYLIAYVIITIGAAAAQGFYKAPIYELLMNTWGMGSFGETAADVVTMTINSAIAFWVFFPIFKIIFKQEPEKQGE